MPYQRLPMDQLRPFSALTEPTWTPLLITSDMVRRAIAEGRLRDKAVNVQRDAEWFNPVAHIERIAFFATRPDLLDLPLRVDFGVKSGSFLVVPGNPVLDGLHRLAAAEVAGRADVLCDLTGSPELLQQHGIAPLRAQADDAAFKAWFAGSKVVDAAGAPLVVYHGTQQRFAVFDPKRIRGRSSNEFGDGFYFTPSADAASLQGFVVVPAYLVLRDPLYVTTMDRGGVTGWHRGHDGVIVGYPDGDPRNPADWAEVVVSSPDQIRLADAPAPSERHAAGLEMDEDELAPR